MGNYHINDDGEVARCKAGNPCTFGGRAQHYESGVNARKAYELSLAAAPPKDGAGNPMRPPLERGEMLLHRPGFSPLVVMHDADPTAPYPVPQGFTLRGRMDDSHTVPQALMTYNLLIRDGLREIERKRAAAQAPRFDSHDAEAAHAARERANVLQARQGVYAMVEAALERTEELAEVSAQLREFLDRTAKPEGAASSDPVQRWQAERNTLGEFIHSLASWSDEEEVWLQANVTPVAYHYSQSYC